MRNELSCEGPAIHTHLQQFRRFAQYNTWFNGQLYDVVATLDATERERDASAFFGSIHATLNHILLCDRMWLGRFTGGALSLPSLASAELVYTISSLSDVLYSDFAALRAARSATDAVLEDFVRDLTPELLASDLDYRNSKGLPYCSPVWHIVAHVFNHQTHHRGQVTALLTQLGKDPGMTDFMVTSIMPSILD